MSTTPRDHVFAPDGFAAIVLVVVVVYGWAWASVDRSSIARAMWWMDDVGD